MNGRDRLLEAAHGLFGTRPYALVGVAEILNRAGVQAPTLYHHFQDKEGLYCDWVVEAFGHVAPKLATDPTSECQLALSKYAEALICEVPFEVGQVLRDTGQMARDESRERIYDAYLQAVFEPLCGILVRGMQRGVLLTEPVARLAEVFLAGVSALRATTPRSSDGAAELSNWWATRFLNGVSVARSAR
jgi:AcrR family transcriptional regulator